VTYYEKRVFNT
jgi:hypothetical protein